MIPFFVVDRPISLKIIEGVRVPRGKKIGLMAHANTTENFRNAFGKYPRRQVVKMCDSAIFNIRGAKNGYDKLFELYEEMGTDYGVMLDVFRDRAKTLESARRALEQFDPARHHFKLVGVAQGKTVAQYLDCYRRLKDMGYEYVAVGGLLQKKEKTARYAYVRNENFMKEVLARIRKEFSPEWLFALGCLHPSRLELFEELEVWGDYKGWIFEYEKRDESIGAMIEALTGNHLSHASSRFHSSVLGMEIRKALTHRKKAVTLQQKAQAELLLAKRDIRDFTSVMIERVRKKGHPRYARSLRALKSRGLFKNSDIRLMSSLLRSAGVRKNDLDQLIALSATSRLKKAELIKAERNLQAHNTKLQNLLKELRKRPDIEADFRAIAAKISKVFGYSEQEYRICQVRKAIETNILDRL